MEATYYPYYPLSAASCCLFLCIYKYISPPLSAFITPSYHQLTPGQKVEWGSRVASNVHAVLAGSAAFYALLYDEVSQNDPVWGDSVMIRTLSSFIIGYMLSDFLIIVTNWKAMGEFGSLFHHFAVVWAYFHVITHGVLPWFANFRVLAELSTPFVNMRWFYDAIGYPRTSKEFIINGLLMTFTFFLSRICVMPPYWYKVYSLYGTPECQRLGGTWYVLIGSCAILDLLNLFWFSKMYNGVRKVLKATDISIANLPIPGIPQKWYSDRKVA